ncbi:hypothetical protein [Streptomyces monomycini]|uniref:hypothetical protein n=1 Tax=Streptomyces monomycini TaxID=371720 RepID=UPI0004AB18E9|nr:hypothetical protein [Streptomyces monomycini]
MTTGTTPTPRRARTRYDERMYAIMNRREASAMYATTGRRRAAVAVHVLLTGVILAAEFTGFATATPWIVLTVPVLVLPWCLATGVLNAALRGLLDLRTHVLDERQLAERDRVRAKANRLTTYVLGCGVAGGIVVGELGGLTVGGAVLPVLISAFVVHWLMPLWVAGMTAQDEPADETDE